MADSTDCYRPGKSLRLIPHDPPRPYGIPGLPERENRMGDCTLRNLDNHQPSAVINICGQLSGGAGAAGRNHLILLCEVTQRPSAAADGKKHAPLPVFPDNKPSLVVAKIYDPLLYPEHRLVGEPPKIVPYTDDNVAEAAHSREAAAYQYMYQNNLTGYPHIAPDYYGSWIVNCGNTLINPWARYVRLILIEYIHGKSIEQLCPRDGPDGHLVPPPGNVPFRGNAMAETDLQPPRLDMSIESRLDMLKDFLHESMIHVKHGLEALSCPVHDIFITLRDNGKALAKPRVVLLSYGLTTVWSDTLEAKDIPEYPLWRLALTPHPFERFSLEAMPDLVGWTPQNWTDEDYDAWLIRTFGPTTADNKDYYSVPEDEYAAYQADVEVHIQGLLREDSGADNPQHQPISKRSFESQLGLESELECDLPRLPHLPGCHSPKPSAHPSSAPTSKAFFSDSSSE